MKTQHTSGPWKTGNKYPTRIIGGQTNIAATALPDDESNPSNEQIANARLIAAAPDLLAAALRSAGFMAKRGVGAGEHDLRVAIAKATGMTFEEVTRASLSAISQHIEEA